MKLIRNLSFSLLLLISNCSSHEAEHSSCDTLYLRLSQIHVVNFKDLKNLEVSCRGSSALCGFTMRSGSNVVSYSNATTSRSEVLTQLRDSFGLDSLGAEMYLTKSMETVNKLWNAYPGIQFKSDTTKGDFILFFTDRIQRPLEALIYVNDTTKIYDPYWKGMIVSQNKIADSWYCTAK